MKKTILFFLALTGLQLKGQIFDWLPLSQTPNGAVYGLTEYNANLYAVGKFDSINTVKAGCIAVWDGMAWASFSKGFRGGNGVFAPLAYNSCVYNNELYVWGDFDSVGTIAAIDIAKWNGNTWTSFGNTGSNGIIYCTAMYNNELYIGGQFGTTGSSPASMIAKWNGSTWLPVGSNGLMGGYVSDLYVYNSELYAVGLLQSVNGNTCNSIARWNGTAWNTVGTGLPWNTQGAGAGLNEPKFTMIEWNGKLLVGSGSVDNNPNYSVEINQWDGSLWTAFSNNVYPMSGAPLDALTKVRKFYKYNSKLLASGGITPTSDGRSHIYEWNGTSNKWDMLGHGPNYSVRTLADFKGTLYCGGLFSRNQGSYFNYIAKLGNVTGLPKERQVSYTVYPNPSSSTFNVTFELSRFIELEIFDLTGKLLRSNQKIFSGQEINIQAFDPGIYLLKIKSDERTNIHKIIKE